MDDLIDPILAVLVLFILHLALIRFVLPKKSLGSVPAATALHHLQLQCVSPPNSWETGLAQLRHFITEKGNQIIHGDDSQNGIRAINDGYSSHMVRAHRARPRPEHYDAQKFAPDLASSLPRPSSSVGLCLLLLLSARYPDPLRMPHSLPCFSATRQPTLLSFIAQQASAILLSGEMVTTRF